MALQLPPDIDQKLPIRIKQRLEGLQNELAQLVSDATAHLKTTLPAELQFEYSHAALGDILTVEERAQSVSFVTRYEHLPTEYVVQLVEMDGNWHVGNLHYVRHVLNDFRPIIQNQSDVVHFQRVPSVWYRTLGQNPTKGLSVTVWAQPHVDVTTGFAVWLGERNRAIRSLLASLEFEYLYNGVLQHSDASLNKRFLSDYVSGDLQYLLWKHMQALDFIHAMLRPYHSLMSQLTFPRLGAL